MLQKKRETNLGVVLLLLLDDLLGGLLLGSLLTGNKGGSVLLHSGLGVSLGIRSTLGLVSELSSSVLVSPTLLDLLVGVAKEIKTKIGLDDPSYM